MKVIFYTLLVTFGMAAAGCSDNGDSGFYDNVYRVYFPEDSILYSFGDKPVEMTSYTVNVPVKILGLPAREGMKIRISVDGKATTAPAEAYRAIPTELSVKKDSVMAYVPVELIRANIPSESDTTFRIVLRLEPNEDFGLGVKESLQTVVVFGGFLAEPEWWRGMQDYFWGPFQKEKYQKMMEIWGGPISNDDFMRKMAKVVTVAKEMYDYFQAHPEYGMEFPPFISWPYE
ncbi:DUF4843 domain-containing protein [Gabonibacter chumensis]|uniref:DUF4843 domain-containing protein n=1 Tax=Gabonibacter chumensis TaxID=2972474 RepID=UPI00257350B3|nr:DUF4843 domain-containing protein [Gabonibacter chumensis]MCR9011548.1 DUF4843 domain-containing protein [Gabonibacter chumensis]